MTTAALPVVPGAAPAAPVAPVAAAPVAAPSLLGGPAPPDGPKIPEGLDPKFWVDGKVNEPELIKSYSELAAANVAATARLAAVPAKPEDYKFDLPADFKAPDGVEVKFDEKANPLLVELRALAHEAKIDQPTLSKLLTLEARRSIKEHEDAVARLGAETTKLGEKGPVRIEAVEKYLNSALAEDEYNAVRGVAITEAGVRAIEKLIAKANGTGIPGALPPPQPPKPSEIPVADRWYGTKQQKVG